MLSILSKIEDRCPQSTTESPFLGVSAAERSVDVNNEKTANDRKTLNDNMLKKQFPC